MSAKWFARTGRVIVITFCGATRQILYRMRANDPEALFWQFADLPYHEPITATEEADVR